MNTRINEKTSVLVMMQMLRAELAVCQELFTLSRASTHLVDYSLARADQIIATIAKWPDDCALVYLYTKIAMCDVADEMKRIEEQELRKN